MQCHALEDGTVLWVQQSTDADTDADSADPSLAVLFDGRPMIDAGIPEMMRSLQEDRMIGPLTTIYVESIEGSTIRGPTRVASLTDPVLLDRLVHTLQAIPRAVRGGHGRPGTTRRDGAQPGRQRGAACCVAVAGPLRRGRHRLRRVVVAR